MKSYSMQVKIRNNYLLMLMKNAGVPSVLQLAKKVGVSPQALYPIVNLTAPLYSANGTLRPAAVLLAEFFGVGVDMVYPPEHANTPLKTNVSTAEVDFSEIAALGYSQEGSIEALEDADTLQYMLNNSGLTELQKSVLSAISEGETKASIAKDCGLSSGRIRQIETKALYKIRRRHSATSNFSSD